MDANGDNLLKSKVEKTGWFRKTNARVRDIILNNEILIVYLSDLDKNNSDYSLTEVLSVEVGVELIKVDLKLQSKQTNEYRRLELIVANTNLNLKGVGVLLFMNRGKVEYIGFENKKSILGTTRQISPIYMHFPDFSQNKLLALPSTVQNEVCLIAGKETLASKFIDLGQIQIGPTMSTEEISMFAIVLEATTINKDKINHIKLVAPKDLGPVVKETRDPLLLSILSKLTSFDII